MEQFLRSFSAMFPNAEMKNKLAFMHHRKHDGSLSGRDHLLRKPLVVDEAGVKGVLNSAGAGAFAKPSDYARKLHCSPCRKLGTNAKQKSSRHFSMTVLRQRQKRRYSRKRQSISCSPTRSRSSRTLLGRVFPMQSPT